MSHDNFFLLQENVQSVLSSEKQVSQLMSQLEIAITEVSVNNNTSFLILWTKSNIYRLETICQTKLKQPIKSHRDLSKDCSFLYILNVTINKVSLIYQLISHLFIKAYIVFILNMEILYHCDYLLTLTLSF